MKVKLNNKFYHKQAIEEAMESFEGVSDFRIVDDSFEIEIISSNGNEQQICHEFCNFVLGLTKDSRLY